MLSQTPRLLSFQELKKLVNEPNIFVKPATCSSCGSELDYDELELCSYCQEIHDIEEEAERQMEANREDI